MHGVHPTNILLFRQPSEDRPDNYEEEFRKAGYHPFSLPVLETTHVNLKSLGDLISGGLRTKGYTGLVATSQRSCEALGRALILVNDNRETWNSKSGWDDLPVYVVGEKTASVLRDIFGQYTIDLDIRGQESGNGSNLADFILSVVHEKSGTKLLYLTGDKNRDTITVKLTEAKIKVESLQVYETRESLSFESKLSSVCAKAPKGVRWWIVYFAPSTANFVTPVLKKYFHLQEIDSEDTEGPGNLLSTRVAVIGPTTHAFLVDELRLRVDAVAPKPEAKCLLSEVEAVEQTLSIPRDSRHTFS